MNKKKTPTWNEKGGVDYEYDFRGLSTDEKPVFEMATGSTFLEVDTGKVFFFDKKNMKWNEA